MNNIKVVQRGALGLTCRLSGKHCGDCANIRCGKLAKFQVIPILLLLWVMLVLLVHGELLVLVGHLSGHTGVNNLRRNKGLWSTCSSQFLIPMKISIPDGSRPIKDHDLPLHVGRHEQQRERHERPCKRCHKRHLEGHRERKKAHSCYGKCWINSFGNNKAKL